MRKAIFGVLIGVGIGLAGMSAAFAGPVTSSDTSIAAVRGTGLQQIQYGGYCARLRWACKNKYALGEAGEGNCRRYRVECGERPSYCERLRRACENKYERGEEGQGNCRRYRAECGRSY